MKVPITLETRDWGMLLNLIANCDEFNCGCTDWAPEFKRMEKEIMKQHNEYIKKQEYESTKNC